MQIVAGENTLNAKVSPTVIPKGTLVISLFPADAIITIGNYTYRSGTYNFDPGTFNWAANESGWVMQSGTFTVEVGKTTPLNVTLVRYTGGLTITYAPASVRLTIDGQVFTPGTVQLDPGLYHWIAELGGYNPKQGDIAIVAGQDAVLDATFQLSTTGNLSVTSAPVGATVTVKGLSDGTTPSASGVTPCQITLNAGNYLVTVSKPGYFNYADQEFISYGQVTNMNVNLISSNISVTSFVPKPTSRTVPSGQPLVFDGHLKTQTSPPPGPHGGVVTWPKIDLYLVVMKYADNEEHIPYQGIGPNRDKSIAGYLEFPLSVDTTQSMTINLNDPWFNQPLPKGQYALWSACYLEYTEQAGNTIYTGSMGLWDWRMEWVFTIV